MSHSIEYEVIQVLHARIIELVAQRDACLAACQMWEADEDDNVSLKEFYCLLSRLGRDPDQESSAEFMIRKRTEAIALCEQEKPNAL